jgi:hypothetical protein
MKIHLNCLFSIFLLFSLGRYTNASQPNTLRCESEGFLLVYNSCGVESISADEGDIFTKYFAVLTASAYNSCASPRPLSIFLSFSINVLFILSINPFFCWVYGVVFWHAMPHFLQNYSKSFSHNSLPISVLNTLIFLSF